MGHGEHVWSVVVVGHKSIVSLRALSLDTSLTLAQLYRWIATGILSMSIEVLLIICPAWLLWTLHMPLRKKLGCAIYFGLRFPTVILTIFRLLVFIKANKETDPTFYMTMPVVLTQLEMHFTVLAATIPILRNPLEKLNSGYLNTTLEQMDPAASAIYISSRSGSSGKGPSIALSHMIGSKRRDDGISVQRSGEGIETIAEGGSDTVEEGQSVLSESSDKIMIKRTVMIDYA
ncbi:hypothetical protein E4T38_03974 [Aureobasidium subglaciale]|nr:hypothetical protein E4T38_03974 [Aureobasidium subglaciale]KAI5224900.1 hypothetical protein E4T40_03749 [Aureobasidium subglaciale]KAI5228026.1 hypothetical protein E4T41_03969 [Aureobasidium subglaciale]KAI5263541.1 hypothetical protein E4T46_03590 [Aureobasidium subglaciale]